MLRIGILLGLIVCGLFVHTASAAETDKLLEEGERLVNSGRYAEALGVYQRAAEQFPDSADAHFKLGGMQLIAHDYAGGVASFQRAISLDPGNANAFVGMAVAYIHMGRFPHAAAALDEAARIDPAKKERVADVRAWLERRMRE